MHVKHKKILIMIAFFASISIAYAEQATVNLTINSENFKAGDTLILSVNMNPNGSSFDEYFALETPNHDMFYLDSQNQGFMNDPAKRRTINNPIQTKLLELNLTEIPQAFYRFWIIYLPAGLKLSLNTVQDWVYDTVSLRFIAKEKSKTELIAVTNTDFESRGTLSILDPKTMTTIDSEAEFLSSDPYLSVFGNRIYVINRYNADNIQVIDPTKNYDTILQFSTGNGSNPHGLAFSSSEKAYISRYETSFNDLLIVNPATGAEIGTIDMKPYADNADKTPRADQMMIINDELFVLVQDLNASWDGFGTSKIVVIDTKTDQVTDTIPLEGKNPGSMKYLTESGLLYVSNFGLSWPYTLSGGIEVIDPIEKKSHGIILDDDTLKGNCGEIEILSKYLGYVIVSDENFVNSVKAFNPETGALLGTIYESPGSFIQSIEITDDGYLLLTERYESASGIFFIDTKDNKIIKGPVSTGNLPPFSISTFHL
jgi:DNA-binding beta-propeller fold protein YncE